MFLTAKQTGGPLVFALRRSNCYLAVDHIANWNWRVQEFDIRQLAAALEQGAGETWQEHSALILLACEDGKLFEWLDKIGGEV